MEIKQKKRDEIPSEYKWNLEAIYPTEANWRKAVDAVKKEIEALEEFEGKLTTGEAIFACLEKFCELDEITGRMCLYANLKLSEDANVPAFQAMADIAESAETDAAAAAAFIDPEILEHSEETIRGFMAAVPGLKKYEHHLNNLLRKKAHTLSAEAEEILANAEEVGGAAEKIYEMLVSADLKFGNVTDENGNSVEVTDARYGTLLRSSDRRVRKDAFETFWGSYWKLKNTFAAMFASSVKKDIFFAETRKYESTLDAALFENNIPRAVYENLIVTVREFLPVFHRYYAVRKKALKVDELHLYDKSVPLVNGADTKIPYDEAKKMLAKGLAPLGGDYVAAMEKGMESGWLDVYESEGKAGGGFQWGAYGTFPYVLLNYEDEIGDMLTLAHEMGHAMHDVYADEAQPIIYANVSIFLAEVASTVNEVLMTEHLIKTADDTKTRVYLLDEYAKMFTDNLFRQVMFAEFEMLTRGMAEDGESLTLEAINRVYRGLNEKYFGPNVVIDGLIDIEWAWIEHFYMTFYVYQYATGLAASLAFAKKLQSGGAGALEDYLGFLKAGGSDYPIEVLKKAGVDMSSPQPVREALKVFEGVVGELEKCFG